MKNILNRLGIQNFNDLVHFSLQFLKFSIVGLSNTLISLAIYYLFIYIDTDLYLWGNIVGWVVGVANSFFWNSRLVFKTADKSIWRQLGKSYIAYGITLIISMGLLYVQVEWFAISEVWAPIFNLIVIVPLNFILNRYWIYR